MNKKAEGRESERDGSRGRTRRRGSVCTQKLQQMEIWGQEIFGELRGGFDRSSGFPRDRCAIAGCGLVLYYCVDSSLYVPSCE